MLIIPAIDIKNGKCVRLTQGNFESEKIYNEDPIAVAKQWTDQGANMLHIVDLDGAKKSIKDNKKVILSMSQCINTSLQVGGGIRDEKTIKKLIENGISRIILGTMAFDNPELFKEIVKKYNQSIIIALDTKNDKVVINGWQKTTNQDLLDSALFFERIGVKRIMFTDTLRDGTLTHPNFSKIKQLKKVLKIPIIVGGGISTIYDIKKLKKIGIEEIIIGKALYEGKIDLKEALNVS
jgi:phosphoribosylformimino-5-aminoimidazole carboxamide ribotide isomerase